MGKSLVIVESPTKERTLSRFLGAGYVVRSSVGHVKDLPKKELGVEVESDFRPKYIIIPGKEKVVSGIKKAAKDVDSIFLAPDPDREGEAIAWHIASELKDDKKIYRVTFHEITKRAVQEAFDNPGEIDIDRVNAQQARRILDRLVGYKISPLLWKYVRPGLSAGRVQSVALRIICDREKEIRAFKADEYWTITAKLRGEEPPEFEASLVKIRGEKPSLKNEDETNAVVEAVKGLPFKVSSVQKKQKRRNPFPPFITSSLQQDASVRCGFSPRKTMLVAQMLYEGVDVGERGTVGLITYMRTDSTRVAQQAVYAARDFISREFGESYVPPSPRRYASRKTAQEAHEAIRPTMVDLTPGKAKSFLTPDQFKLYELIWNRFVASQMASAVYDMVEVEIEANGYLFKTVSSILKFDGFLRVYKLAAPEPKGKEGEAEKKEVVLPPLEKGQVLTLVKVLPEQHFTKPPPRFSEASLVKELEKLGIGRPSTYAAIVTKIQNRNYTSKVKGRLVPTELGFVVTDKLVENFPDILNVGFTADMEGNLDKIEEGKVDWVETLRGFYSSFSKDLAKASEGMRIQPIDTDVVCEECGSPMAKKWGKNGFFLACSAYPKCRNTKDIAGDDDEKLAAEIQEKAEPCEKCGGKMVVKRGRYGPFLACSNYPKCKNIRSISEGPEGKKREAKPVETDEKCPDCGRPLVRRKGRYGWFVGCSGYPECKFIKKEGKVTFDCPREGCNGKLVRRRTRRGKTFYGCSNYPKCDFAVWNLSELKEKRETDASSE